MCSGPSAPPYVARFPNSASMTKILLEPVCWSLTYCPLPFADSPTLATVAPAGIAPFSCGFNACCRSAFCRSARRFGRTCAPGCGSAAEAMPATASTASTRRPAPPKAFSSRSPLSRPRALPEVQERDCKPSQRDFAKILCNSYDRRGDPLSVRASRGCVSLTTSPARSARPGLVRSRAWPMGARIRRGLTGDQLRALSHPLRLRIVEVLREGPATASALGRRLGESSGATSYHLRALAKAGWSRRTNAAPSASAGGGGWIRSRSSRARCRPSSTRRRRPRSRPRSPGSMRSSSTATTRRCAAGRTSATRSGAQWQDASDAPR